MLAAFNYSKSFEIRVLETFYSKLSKIYRMYIFSSCTYFSLSSTSTVSSFLISIFFVFLFLIISSSLLFCQCSFCFPLSTLSLPVTSFFLSFFRFLTFSTLYRTISPSFSGSPVFPTIFFIMSPAIKYVIMLLPRKSRK